MKKHLLLFLFAVSAIGLFGQNLPANVQKQLSKNPFFEKIKPFLQTNPPQIVPTCRPDSTVSFDKTIVAPDSFAFAKSIFQYDANGNQTKKSDFQRNDDVSPWDVVMIFEQQFNATGAVIFDQTHAVDGAGQLFVQTKNFYHFKSANAEQLDSQVVWQFDNGSGETIRSQRIRNEYAANGAIATSFSDAFDSQIGWVLKDRSIYAYDAGQKIESIEISSWDGTVWVPVLSQAYTYGANDSLSQILEQDLQLSEPVTRFDFTYDLAAHTQHVEISQWDGAAWAIIFKITADRDDLGRQEFDEVILDIPGLFTFGQQHFFHYASGSNCVHFTDDWVSEDGVNFIEIGPTHYFYGGSIIATDAPTEAKKASATPNPFAADGFFAQADAGSQMRLFNATGMLIEQKTAAQSQTFFGADRLPSGAYFLKIDAPSGSSRTIRLLKMD